MTDIVSTFRSYALDKDNFPRMDSEVVHVRVSLLNEAAEEITTLRAENENLRTALKDVLFWAAQVAGDTIDMEAREIEIASVERAIAVLGKSDVEV